MNGATIQAKIWRGYAKAAQILGSDCQIYRPTTWEVHYVGGKAWYLGNLLYTRKASFNAEDMKYSKPSKTVKSTWYALVDGTSLLTGDYLIASQGTFFIAALQPLLPILVVGCNRTATFARVQAQDGLTAPDYSGMTAQNEIPYASGVPCSIMQGTKGEKNEVSLPSDPRVPWWTVLAPASIGLVQYGDLVFDDLNRRYIVSSAELSDSGYRITAAMITP